MADYDSDSSGADDIETGVTLGYASKEPTGDDFSRLGGQPTWLDPQSSPPPGNLAKCKVCSGLLSFLFQLNGDLPDRFVGHERRLYLFGCRRKACRRKDGSIRGLRYTKIDASVAAATNERQTKQASKAQESAPSQPRPDLGNALFGVKSPRTAAANPFGAPAQPVANPFGALAKAVANPFAAATTTAAEEQTSSTTDLSQTFAAKARIGTHSTTPKPVQSPPEAWPEASSFPEAYPSYFIDADKEFLDAEPEDVPQRVQITEVDEAGGSSSGGTGDDKAAFESSMDKAFQKFADRMAQNPEQVLRYDYGGQPLLYSKKDAIGKIWPRIPRCSQCGSTRQFELQLTPHAITELEAEDISLDGMDWGTVILAVCGHDCEGWTEEWVGVQWEELTGKKAA